jgi:hypothetical protein
VCERVAQIDVCLCERVAQMARESALLETSWDSCVYKTSFEFVPRSLYECMCTMTMCYLSRDLPKRGNHLAIDIILYLYTNCSVIFRMEPCTFHYKPAGDATISKPIAQAFQQLHLAGQ